MRFEAHVRVSPSVDEEGSMLHRRVSVVVVREFGEWQQGIPVVLAFVDENSDVLFEFLIDVFGLAIRLRVICCGCRNLDAQEAIQFAHELCDELWSAIRDH
jgi:hypothetical protein